MTDDQSIPSADEFQRIRDEAATRGTSAQIRSALRISDARQTDGAELADVVANELKTMLKTLLTPVVQRIEKLEGLHIDMERLCKALERDGPAQFRKAVERHAEHLTRLQTDVSALKSKLAKQ